MKSELEYYTCVACHGLVAPWEIEQGGCQNCGGARIRPANLTALQKLLQFFRPAFWRYLTSG